MRLVDQVARGVRRARHSGLFGGFIVRGEEVLREFAAREWIEENKKGGNNFAKLRDQAKNHPIEKVGEQLRKMMSWLPTGKKKSADEAKSEKPHAVNA